MHATADLSTAFMKIVSGGLKPQENREVGCKRACLDLTSLSISSPNQNERSRRQTSAFSADTSLASELKMFQHLREFQQIFGFTFNVPDVSMVQLKAKTPCQERNVSNINHHVLSSLSPVWTGDFTNFIHISGLLLFDPTNRMIARHSLKYLK